jgi:hypothetical protein
MQSFTDNLCNKFSFGKCSTIGCNLRHIRCNYNISCTKSDCKFGHVLNIDNRIQMNNIYNIYRMKDREYKKGAEFCTYNMTCINHQCSGLHPFGIESRIQVHEKFHKLKNLEKSDDKIDVGTMTDNFDIKNEDVSITSSVEDSELFTKNVEVSKKTENVWNKTIKANIKISEKKEDEDYQTVVKKTTIKSFKSEISKVPCKYNICCTHNNCTFHHPIHIEGRKNINKLYLEYREINREYRKGKSFCDKNILCENEDCENIHSFGFEYRLKIICEYMSFIDKETPVKIEVKTQPSIKKNIDLSINSLEDFPSIKKTQSSSSTKKIEDKKNEDKKIEDKKIEDTKNEDKKIEDTKIEDKKNEDKKIEDTKIEDKKNKDKKKTQPPSEINKKEEQNEFV